MQWWYRCIYIHIDLHPKGKLTAGMQISIIFICLEWKCRINAPNIEWVFHVSWSYWRNNLSIIVVFFIFFFINIWIIHARVTVSNSVNKKKKNCLFDSENACTAGVWHYIVIGTQKPVWVILSHSPVRPFGHLVIILVCDFLIPRHTFTLIQ
jgi:hypothetical protein